MRNDAERSTQCSLPSTWHTPEIAEPGRPPAPEALRIQSSPPHLVEVAGLVLVEASQTEVVGDEEVGRGEAEQPILVAGVGPRRAQLHQQLDQGGGERPGARAAIPGAGRATWTIEAGAARPGERCRLCHERPTPIVD